MYTSYPEKGFQSLHRRMSFSLSGAAAAAAMGGSAALASLQKHQFKKGYYEGSSEETENLQFDQQHARHHEEQNWILEFDGYDPKTEGIREALLTLGNGVFATRGACEMSSSHATVSSNKDDESTKAHTAAQDKTQQTQQPTIGLPPPVTSCHYAGTYFNGYFNRSDSKVSDRYITNEDLVNFPNWLPITFKIMGEKQQVVQLEKKTTSPPVRSSPAERSSIGAAAAATTTASIPPYEPATTLQPTTQEFVENQQEEQKQLQQELIEHLKNMSTNSAQLQAKVLDEEQAALTKTETATQGSSAAKQQSAATDEEDQWTTLENCKRIDRYKQWLNLKEGVLYRKLTIVDHKDRITTITTRRFVHMGGSHIGCIDFAITPENWSGEFHIRCSIDASVCNNGVARYRNLNAYHFDTVDIGHERFANSTDTIAFATVLTRQSHIEVATAQRVRVFMNEIQCTPHENYTVNAARNVIHCDLKLHAPPLHQHNGDEDEEDEDYDDENFEAQKTEEAANGYSPKTRRARERRTFHIEKVCSLVGSKDFGITNVKNNAVQMLSYIPNFEVLLNQHKTAWEMLWTRMDTIITPKTALEDDGNEAADTKAKQQGNDVEKNKNKNTNTTTVEEPTTTTTTITETKSSESTRENNLSKSSVRESTTSTNSTETNNNNNNTSHNKHKKKKHKPIIEQIILRLHTFHCLQVLSTNSLDRDVSVPARGIHGESYRGHIFWDELYIMPFFTTKLPEVARLIPKYRYKRINMARINAIKKGLHGALFPWQSGSDGQEETQQIHLNPLTQQWGPDLSSAQYHGNIAIAYNILRYFDLTRDVGFMEDFGAEIVLEIAKMFASLARYNHETERYDIVGVMGPDEYHESFPGSSEQGLRNNAYTNVMVVWLLNRSYELLKNIRSVFRKKITHTLNITDEVLRRWRDISHNMFVPFHYFTPSHSSAAAASASTGGASNPTSTSAATTGSSTAAAASGTTAAASTATTATTSTSGHSRKKLIMSQFEGYEHLKELDWEHYRSKYQSIGRMDRILKAENDTPDHYKVSKQADVCMLFYLLTPKEIHDLMKLLGYEITDSFIPDNVEYYMNRTCHGSTLSYLVHAAILYGIDANKSWDFFIQALNSDYNDIQGGTTQEGIHMAIMAGTVDLVMHKFAGLDMTRDALSLNPCIPGQLAEIQFYLHWRNDIVQLRITHDFLEIKFEDEYKMPSSSSSSNLRMRTKDKGTGKGDEDNGEAVIVPIFLHGQLFAVSKSRKSKLSIDSCTFCGPYYLCAKCHKHIGKNHDHHVCRICSKVYCPPCTETEASNKLKLEQFKHVVKPVRCCNSCFETVKEIPVAPRV